jgi:hypothetical protein
MVVPCAPSVVGVIMAAFVAQRSSQSALARSRCGQSIRASRRSMATGTSQTSIAAAAAADSHSTNTSGDRCSLAVRRIAGAKGRGLFALRAFAAGDVVLAQRPLCAVVRPHAFGRGPSTPSPSTDEETQRNHISPSILHSPSAESPPSASHCAHCLAAFSFAPARSAAAIPSSHVEAGAAANSSSSRSTLHANTDTTRSFALTSEAACVTCARTDVFCSAQCARAHHRQYRGLMCECRLGAGANASHPSHLDIPPSSLADESARTPSSSAATLSANADSANKYPIMAARLMLEALFAANSPPPTPASHKSVSKNLSTKHKTVERGPAPTSVEFECIPPSPDGS